MRRVVCCLAGLLLLGCSEDATRVVRPEPGKVLYGNALIYTQGADGPWAEALVTDGEDIVFVGSGRDAERFVDENTRRMDLRGAFVMPGLIDTHTHPGLVGTLQLEEGVDREAQTLPTRSKEDLYSFLQRYADDHFWQPFVMLGSWDVHQFLPDGPRKEDLDRIFKYKPVVLTDNSGHSLWLNSSALWLAGVDEDTPDLSPGLSYFVRDADGEPTGWVKEFAIMAILGDYLVPGKDELKQGIGEYLDFLSANGVTTLMDAGNFGSHDAVYAAVSDLDREGKLPVRYFGTFHIWAPEHIGVAVEELKALREKYGSNRLVFETIKIHFDGVAEILTAGMLEPYVTEPDNRGGVLFDTERLTEFVAELNREGIDLHLHTVGDRAARVALDAVERVQKEQGRLGIEVSLSHLETVAPEDIPRFKQLGVHANFTPHWFGGLFGTAGAHNLGEERAFRSQVIQHFVDAGANVTLSSDVVSEDEAHRAAPFIGMQMSVTRREYTDSREDIVMDPPSARTILETAMSGYTINAARQLGLAESQGSLEPGKKADFVVLDRNPFDVEIQRLHTLEPRAVVVGGVVESGSL
jgi:predicted amidohydrolase YtcJ